MKVINLNCDNIVIIDGLRDLIGNTRENGVVEGHFFRDDFWLKTTNTHFKYVKPDQLTNGQVLDILSNSLSEYIVLNPLHQQPPAIDILKRYLTDYDYYLFEASPLKQH